MIFSYFNYFVVVFILCAGLYIVATSKDLVKKLFGINIFQISVLLFYISLGFIKGSNIPIIAEGVSLYSNPLPHVLMLTAIVVGLATTSVGLSLIIMINKK